MVVSTLTLRRPDLLNEPVPVVVDAVAVTLKLAVMALKMLHRGRGESENFGDIFKTGGRSEEITQ